jgi:chitodextrinase
LPLVDTPAAPGSSGSATHEDQTNGTAYTYALFAVDPSGNASAPAEVESTPAADPPPVVTNLRRTDKQ